MSDPADNQMEGSGRTSEMEEVLRDAPLTVLGRMPWSSNATFLVELDPTNQHSGESERTALRAVYKPAAGEQPLWDFPDGLWKREIAAYRLSEALGFDLVPETVHRPEGPYGPGSIQRFINARFDEHYFTIREMPGTTIAERLRLLCAFDIIANSADRKGGHCLIDREDRIWAIDNGLTFHVELKIRTVIWDFAGEPLPQPVRAALLSLSESGPPDSVVSLLDDNEVEALLSRTERLLASGHFPFDPTGRRHPWPLV